MMVHDEAPSCVRSEAKARGAWSVPFLLGRRIDGGLVGQLTDDVGRSCGQSLRVATEVWLLALSLKAIDKGRIGNNILRFIFDGWVEGAASSLKICSPGGSAYGSEDAQMLHNRYVQSQKAQLQMSM
ncbi:hypothetical protein [Mesorhizobium sp. M1E.F.Ca.ET.045.02.1.1]|uniref:hypothetical protein n=1 Tax=Mesorhizobium sp. M1E.F.Ca.ET.045.02.1.1 TaxID=2493672 RepID=UPI00167C26DB|nr:hypothetical protein [Mesorhizobium sp. M1E.F.Ca.ET.045.02.1.1]